MSTALEVRAALVTLLTSGGATPLTASQRATAATSNTLPAHYTEIFLSERVTESRRVGGIGSRAWRLQTRAVAKSEDNAETERAKAAAALEEQFITVGGIESSALARGSTDDPIAPDDGWFSGLSEWLFYH
jgi:hypothetical protein